MKRKVKVYSDEFKFKVVQEYLNSDLSQKELNEKYSIGGPNPGDCSPAASLMFILAPVAGYDAVGNENHI
ncbi:MAG TPA: transposase [Bacteroidales bacterium]|nr:transposase [Bacteroidales bacterium]